MTYDKAKAKADALLIAGDALGKDFPAKSKELLQLCRQWRLKQRDLETKEQSLRKPTLVGTGVQMGLLKHNP